MDNVYPPAISREALLVGPSYKHLQEKDQLPGVHYDLKVMENVTKTFGFGDNVKKVAGDDATKSNILDALEDLSNSAQPESVVLFYYSGHGCYLPDTKDEGLVPADITSDMLKQAKDDNFITGKDLLPFLEQLTDKNVKLTVIFDCCYSGQLYRLIKLRNSGCTDKIPKQVIAMNTESPSGVRSKGTGTKIRRGWMPSEKDAFFYIAACSSVQLATEERGRGGRLTMAIESVINDIHSRLKSFENVSNMAFFRLIVREFQEEGWYEEQTPQLEGLSSDTELFGVKEVLCRSGITVKEVIGDEVVLDAGRLQNLLTGVYNVFEATVLADSIDHGKNASDWLGTIDVSEGRIGPIETSSLIIERNTNTEKTIRARCLAYLADRSNNFKTNARVKISPDDCVPEDRIDELLDNIKKTQLLNASKEPFKEEDKDLITIGIELFDTSEKNKEKFWVARQRGDIIVPPSALGRENIMGENLSRYLRYKAALAVANSPKSRDKLLENVSVKVVKIEKVKPFTALSKEDRIQEGLKSGKDLYEDPFQEPVLKSHSLIGPKSSKLNDGTGDAFVFQVTNNNAEEKDTVHICVLFFQFDGAIKPIYPPKKGETVELRGNAGTAENIFRVFIPFNSLRKMAQPDPNQPEPDRGVDTIVVYAASKPANFKELLQTAIKTDPNLTTRGNEEKTEPLSNFADFLSLLRKRCLEDYADEEDLKWFVEKKEFAVVKNLTQDKLQ